MVSIFLNFLAAGLVPPFSNFFMVVLEHFQLHVLHIHPNAMLVPVIFSHFCEGFLGVGPSLEIFRHLFLAYII